MRKEYLVNSLALYDFPKDKPLFKFLKKEYTERLFDNGELRIGTLYYFREEEQHGSQRGDSGEGKKEIFEDVENVTVEDPSKNISLSPFVQKFIKLEDSAKNMTLLNCTFSELHNSFNYYIYCMSKEFNKALYDAFETDICIKIKSPNKFIKYISTSLTCANLIKLAPVIYGARRLPFGNDNEYHPSVIKPEDYKYQKEVRAIWAPKQHIDRYWIDINVPVKCIRRCCEIFDKN